MQPNRHIGAFLAAAVFFSGMCCFAFESKIDLADYEWRSGISGSLESGVVYRARLTASIFDGCKSFPLDLKVIDRDGRIFPSIVWAKKSHEELYPVRIISVRSVQVNEKEGYASSQFKLRLQGNEKESPIHNRVIINLRGGAFLHRAEVWGGDDRDHLKLLGSGILAERKSPFSVRRRSIDYPDSTARFIEVRVYDYEDTSITWNSTDFVRVVDDEGKVDEIDLRRMKEPADHIDQQSVMSVYFDAGAKNRPLGYMDIRLDGDDYALPIRVYGRNDETNSWRWVADAGVYKIGKLSQSQVMVSGFDYRFIKIEVYHGWQEAPKINEVTASVIPHFLYFVTRSEERAHLYFGSLQYLLPAAELSARINAGMRDNSKTASLGKRHANPARLADSLHRYSSTMLKLGVGILLLFGAIVVVRIARNRFF